MWGLLLIPMFGTAQFFPVSWMLQAALLSALSLVGTVAMSGDGKLDVLLGQKRTLDLGALRLGNPDVIGIAAD